MSNLKGTLVSGNSEIRERISEALAVGGPIKSGTPADTEANRFKQFGDHFIDLSKIDAWWRCPARGEHSVAVLMGGFSLTMDGEDGALFLMTMLGTDKVVW